MRRALGIAAGAGAGFADDRIEPALTLAEGGAVDCPVFECLSCFACALERIWS